MVARLITHPFALTVSGRVATAEQNSDTYFDSQIRVVVGTRIGERDMCLPFGVPDPTFARLAIADIQTCIDRFGPDGIRVSAVIDTVVDDTTVHSRIEWARR